MASSEDGAGDVAGGVGSQVEAGRRDVVHVAGAADGHAVLEQMAAEFGDAVADGRVDGARRDHVDADLLADQLDGGGARQGVEPSLGGDIGREVWRRHRPEGRADMDDAAAAPLAHARDYRLGEDEGPDQVDSQYFGEVHGADLGEGRAQPDGGAVHEDVHTAVLTAGGVEQPGDVFLAAGIAADGQRRAPGRFDGLHGGRQGVGAPAEDDDTRALCAKQLGRRAADAGAAARDQRDFAVKRAHRLSRWRCRRAGSSRRSPSWGRAGSAAPARCTR